MEVTTVADDLVVIHDGLSVYRYDGLTPSTSYTFNGIEVMLGLVPEIPAKLIVNTAPVLVQVLLPLISVSGVVKLVCPAVTFTPAGNTQLKEVDSAP